MSDAEYNESASPSELVLARCRAFGEGNFGFIYDSYHSESYFRAQFPSRRAYVRHGADTLAGDFRIRECRILKEEIEGDEARVLFYLDTLFQKERAESFELSFLRRTRRGWRYHSSQKLPRGDFEGEIEEIDIGDFDRVRDKIFF
jgi:SEC-C motif-containing protein